MNRYKITNTTNLRGKRDLKFNSELKISYVDNMIKKELTIKPSESVYLTIPTLPLSIHRLRIKGLVTVVEISEKELNDIIKKQNKPKIITIKEKTKPTITNKKTTTTKSSGKKNTKTRKINEEEELPEKKE